MSNEAAQAYDATGSELSLPFYRLVIAAAREARGRGQRCRSEALLRRAVLLSTQLGDPDGAAALLSEWTQWPPMPQVLDSKRAVLTVDTACDLMRWQPRAIDFAATGPQPYRWYLLAPAGWADDPQRRASEAIETIFARCNARLAANEPSDANFIGAEVKRVRVLGPVELMLEPWRDHMTPTTWSPSRGFVVEDSGAFFAAHANDFIPMAHLALVVAGELGNDASLERLGALGFSQELLARHREPRKELEDALAYFVRS